MTVEDGSGPADGVVVISTGLANVGSVVNMCRRLGVDPLVTGDPSVVESAALGFSQMRRIDQILLDRRTTAGRYDEALAHLHGVRVPRASPGTTWSYQSYVVVLDDGIDREDVIAEKAAMVSVAHGEGRVEFSQGQDLHTARAQNELCLRYVDNSGAPTDHYPLNPNGSPEGLTALSSADGRATIMMPHPERVFRNVQLSWRPQEWAGEEGPWLKLFQNARAFADEN